MTIAPKSSKIANESKKSFKALGTRLPSSITTPTAKAMSVAVGIAQPLSAKLSPKFSNVKIKAGIAIPPKAPNIGNDTDFMLLSCPHRTSYLSSSPIHRKKIVISPSFIQCSRLLESFTFSPVGKSASKAISICKKFS